MTSGFTPGGLPPQSATIHSTAIFTEAYAVIPGSVLTDITASLFPGWRDTRGWILARPMTGFAETFVHCLMDMDAGAIATDPEPDPDAAGALYVARGSVRLTLDGDHRLEAGGFAYLPPGLTWTLESDGGASVHWIRKAYEPVDGLPPPAPIITAFDAAAPIPMANAPGWSTRRFMDPTDLAHDFHVTVVTLEPGSQIPFLETHVMEHSLHVLRGRGLYRLNQDWVEVEAGDTMILRAFCPQACIAQGDQPFRYLLYKDVNRHPTLRLP